MQISDVKRIIAKDLAEIQKKSDVLSQWPISSVEAMYYTGPFLVPGFAKQIGEMMQKTNEDLLSEGINSGKLSSLIFFFLNKKTKEEMGTDNYKMVLDFIINKIEELKKIESSERMEDIIVKNRKINKIENNDESLTKTVFLLDNLTEMTSPIFRTFGYQIFFNEDRVYRYYHRTNLGFDILVKSPVGKMDIDYFYHILRPEEISSGEIYIISNGDTEDIKNISELNDLISNKIKSIKENESLDRKYVIKQTLSPFGIEIDEKIIKHGETEFPEGIVDFYKKTCELPLGILEKEIYNILI